MQNRLPEKNPKPKGLAARLDRAAGTMNAFLLVAAIGLATLDLTCLWAFKLRDALPRIAPAAGSTAVQKPGAQKTPEVAPPRAARSLW